MLTSLEGPARWNGRRAGLLFGLAVTVSWAAAVTASGGSRPTVVDLFVAESRSADAVPRYDVFELSLRHNGRYASNFFDVMVSSVFTSPSGFQRTVGGFYYSGDVWKVRFAPDELGHWTYRYVMSGEGGFHQEGEGTFECLPSTRGGPLRRNPENPYRWVFDDGASPPTVHPYYPVGLQTCIRAWGAQIAPMPIDGEERWQAARKVAPDEYFAIYGQAGFNLLRFSQRNCSYALFEDLDHVLEAQSLATDALLVGARGHGFRVMFGLFGYYAADTQEKGPFQVIARWIHGLFGRPEEAITNVHDRATIAKEQRFIEYCVARWGVYVDIWELLNERHAADEWTTRMAEHVRTVDPAHKPVTTSWERPALAAIDINAPHWYESENELESDRRIQQKAAEWKAVGKPVIVGEQGNRGMNWDPRSATRMRIRTWTALFEEISLVFWNTSWSKAGMHGGHYNPDAVANIYLGPEERGYIHTLQDFASRLDAGVRIVPVEVSLPSAVRAYGLRSKTVAALYVHHEVDHAAALNGLTVTLDLPDAAPSAAALVGEWIDPATGTLLLRVSLLPGRRTVEVPPFTIDLALLVTAVEHPSVSESVKGSIR